MNTGFYALQDGQNRRQGSKAFSVKMDQDISLALFLWARSLQTYKKYLFVLSVCVRCTYVPQHMCRGQRTIWSGQLSPSTMQVSHSKPSCQASQPSQQDFNQRMQLQEVLGSRCSGYLPEYIQSARPGCTCLWSQHQQEDQESKSATSHNEFKTCFNYAQLQKPTPKNHLWRN